MKYAYDILVKRLGSNLLIIIQITIAVLLVNVLIMQLNSVYSSFTIIKRIKDEPIIWAGVKINNYGDAFSIKTDELKGLKGRITTSTGSACLENRFYTTFVTYPLELFELVSLPLSQGKWNEKNKGDRIPIYLIQNQLNYKIGDILDITLRDNYVLKAYVAGLLAKPQFFYLGISGNEMAALDFTNYSSDISDPYFIVDERYIPNDQLSVGSACFFVFDKKISPQELAENKAKLSKQAYVSTINEIYNNSNTQVIETDRLFRPIILCVCTIAFFALVSINVLNTIYNIQFYSVLYLCGINRRYMAKVGILYSLLIALISFCLCVITYSLAGIQIIRENGWYFSRGNLLFTIFIYGFSILTPLLIQQKILSGDSITGILHENISRR